MPPLAVAAIPAVIGAGASIIGAKKQAKAAKNATNATVAGQQQSVALQQEAAARAEEFIRTGSQQALDQLNLIQNQARGELGAAFSMAELVTNEGFTIADLASQAGQMQSLDILNASAERALTAEETQTASAIAAQQAGINQAGTLEGQTLQQQLAGLQGTSTEQQNALMDVMNKVGIQGQPLIDAGTQGLDALSQTAFAEGLSLPAQQELSNRVKDANASLAARGQFSSGRAVQMEDDIRGDVEAKDAARKQQLQSQLAGLLAPQTQIQQQLTATGGNQLMDILGKAGINTVNLQGGVGQRQANRLVQGAGNQSNLLSRLGGQQANIQSNLGNNLSSTLAQRAAEKQRLALGQAQQIGNLGLQRGQQFATLAEQDLMRKAQSAEGLGTSLANIQQGVGRSNAIGAQNIGNAFSQGATAQGNAQTGMLRDLAGIAGGVGAQVTQQNNLQQLLASMNRQPTPNPLQAQPVVQNLPQQNLVQQQSFIQQPKFNF